MNSNHPPRLTRRERQVIAEHLRRMAGETQLLVQLADATLCGDVAALLRARAVALEHPEPHEPGLRPAGIRPANTVAG